MSDLILESQAKSALELAKQFPDREDIVQASATVIRSYKSQQESAGLSMFPEQERIRGEQYATLQSFYTDPNHGMDDETLASMNETLRGAEDEKYKIFNKKYFEFHGIPKDQVDSQADQLINAYGLQEFKKPISTHKEFFDSISADFKAEKQVEDMAREFTLAKMGPLDSEAQFRERMESVPGYAGREAKWRDQFLKNKEFLDGKRDDYKNEIWQLSNGIERKNFEGTVSPVARFSKFGGAEEPTEAGLQRRQEMLESPSNAELAELVMGIPAEDRPFVIAAAAADATKDPRGRKDFMLNFVDQFARGFDQYVEGFPLLEKKARAIGIKALIRSGFPMSEEDAATPESLFAAAQSNLGVGPAIASLIGTTPATVSEETKAGALKLADRLIEAADLTTEIRNAAEQDVDPTTSEFAAVRGMYALAGSAPYMVAAAIPGGALLNTGAYAELGYQMVRSRNPEMSAEQAMGIGAIAAPFMAYVERLQFRTATGQLTNLNRFYNQVIATKGGVAPRFLGRTAATVGLEMVQENIQDVTPFVVQGIISAVSEDMPNVPVELLYKDMLAQQPELFFAILPLAVMGGGAGTYSDFRNGRALLSSYDELRAQGLSEAASADIRALANKGDYDGAQSLLREEFKTLGQDQKSVQEARVEAIPKLLASYKAQSEALQSGIELDILPAILQQRDGKVALRYNDGTEVSYDTHAEAMQRFEAIASSAVLALHRDSITAARMTTSQMLQGREVKLIVSPLDPTTTELAEQGVATEEQLQKRKEIEETDKGITPKAEEARARALTGIAANSSDARDAASYVLGSSQNTEAAPDSFGDRVIRTTARVYARGTPFTVIEEISEGDIKFMITEGKVSRQWIISALRQWETTSNDSLFRKSITDDSQIENQDIVEAYSKMVVSYFAGRAKAGDQGRIFSKETRDFVAKALRMDMNAVLTGYASLFEAVYRRAAMIEKARKEKTLPADLESFLAKSAGMSPQKVFEREVVKEGEGIAEEMGVEFVDEKTFSTITPAQVTPQGKRHADLEDKFNAGTISEEETAEAQRLVDEKAIKAGYDPQVLYHNTDVDPNRLKEGFSLPAFFTPDFELFSKKGRNKIRVYVNRGKEFRPSTQWETVSPDLMAQGYKRQNDFDTVTNWSGKVVRIDGKASQIKSAEPFTGVPLDQRFDQTRDEITFSTVTPAVDAEYLALAADPVKNETKLREMAEKVVGPITDAETTQSSDIQSYNTWQKDIDYYQKKLDTELTEEQEKIEVEQVSQDREAWVASGRSLDFTPAEFLSGLREGLRAPTTVEDVQIKFEVERNSAIKQIETAKARQLPFVGKTLTTPFKTGKPVTVRVFHATPFGRLERFDADKLGSYTGAPSATKAHFFAGSRSVSETYLADDANYLNHRGFLRLNSSQQRILIDALREEAYTNGIDDIKDINPYEVQAIAEDLFPNLESYDVELVDNQVHEIFLKLQNPLVIDYKGSGYREQTYFEALNEAEDAGHDGVIFANTTDPGPASPFEGWAEPTNIFALLAGNENQAKSADPVTYDESGNVIPLSHRFNPARDEISFSVIKSYEYLRDDNRFDKLQKEGRVVLGAKIEEFIDKHILLHSPDNAFSGVMRLTDGREIKGTGGVYYPLVFADENFFWASTEDKAKQTANHLNIIGEKNGGRIFMALVSAPVEKLFSSSTMARGTVTFFNALAAKPSKSGITKDDLNKMLEVASKVVVQKKSATTGKITPKQFSFTLRSDDTLKKNLGLIADLVNPKKSIFDVRKAFSESIAQQVAKLLKGKESESKYVAGILADAENKHAKRDIRGGKLSKESIVQGLGHLFTEPFLRDFEAHGNGRIYAILEVEGEVEAIASDLHDSYPYAIVPKNRKSKVILHKMDKAYRWQDTVGYETGGFVEEENFRRVMPTGGTSSTKLKVLGPKSDATAPEISFSVIRVTPDNPVLDNIDGIPAAEIFKSAKNRHGVTRSIYEAGYVLPDGTMLDFSGRADAAGFKQLPNLSFVAESGRDYMRDQRGVDHREIEWEGMKPAEEQWSSMVDFLRLGAIRIDANSGMISMHSRAKVTSSQMSVLKDIVRSAGGAFVDLEDDAGNRASMSLEGDKFGKVNGLLTRWASGETPTFEGTTFSVIRPIGDIDSRFTAMFSPFQRSPELRAKLGIAMREKTINVESELAPIIRAFYRTKSEVQQEATAREKSEYDRLLRETFGADTEAKQKALPLVDRKAARSDAKRVAKQWMDGEMKKKEVAPREVLIGFLRTLDAIQRTLPVEVRGKIGGFVALAKLTTPAAMLEEIERRVERIDSELEKYLKKEAEVRRKKLFKLAKPKREAGKKPKGKAGADIHDLFDRLAEAMLWDGTKAEGWATTLEAQIASGELSPEAEAHAKIEANLVRLFSDWNDTYIDTGKKGKNGRRIVKLNSRGADAARRTVAVEAAEEVWKAGYLAEQTRIAKERERRAQIRADIIAGTGKLGSRPERVAKSQKDAGLSGQWKEWFLSLFNFEQVLGFAFGDNSKWTKWFSDQQRTAENQKLDEIQSVLDGLDALFRKLGGSRLGGEKLQWKLSQPSFETKKSGKMSELEGITAILMWRQEDGKRHMAGKRDENGKITSTWAYDQAFVDEIQSKLSAEALEVMDYLVDQYAGEYETLNPIFREINGINLPRNDKYSPLSVKPQQAPNGQTTDPVTGSTMSNGSMTPGSLRTRAQVVAEPDFRNAIEVFVGHKKQLAHWKAYALFIRDAQGVLGNREVSNSIEASSGQEAVRVIRSWLDLFAQGGVRDAGAHLALTKALSGAMGRASAIQLVGRLGTLAIQTTQLGAASAKMPFISYASRLSKLLTGRLSWADALNSPYIQRRLAQMPPSVQIAMEGLRAGKPNAVKHAVQRIGRLLAGTDALFTAGTFAIVYDYQLAKSLKAGVDPVTAAEVARNEAERIVDEIAQPTRQGTRSLFESTTTNPLGRVAWAFASEARKNMALVAYTGAKRPVGELSRALLYVIVFNGVLSSLIRTAWKDLRDDDEDEDEWSLQRILLSVATEPLYGFPGFGEIAQDAIFAAAGEYKPSGSILDAPKKIPTAIVRAPENFQMLLEGDLEQPLRDLETLLMAGGLFNDNIAAVSSLAHIVRDAEALIRNFTQD